MNTNSLFQAIN